MLMDTTMRNDEAGRRGRIPAGLQTYAELTFEIEPSVRANEKSRFEFEQLQSIWRTAVISGGLGDVE